MSDYRTYGPWHTVTVEATWYCAKVDYFDSCRDPEGFCGGHNTDADGREIERDYAVEHPDDCPIPPCCCEGADSDWLRESIDPECQAGHHDACLNRGNRCYTEDSIREWGDMYEESKVSGVYRVRAWGSGPDWRGEYDAGIDWEPVEAVTAS